MGIKSVILESIQRLNEKKVELGQALSLPATIYIVINILDFFNDNPQEASPFIMITGLISFLLSVIMAITIHRVVILEDSGVSKWGNFKWTKRETTFALYCVLLGIFVIASMLPVIFLVKSAPMVAMAIATFFLSFILSRLSLVFPGISLDHEISFKKSMELTKNHQLTMIFVVLILPLLFMLPAVPLLLSVGKEGMNIFYLSYFLMVYSLSAVCTVTALSVAYKQILMENERGV